MGYVYSRTDSYSIGLLLLSVTAALAMILTLTAVRSLVNNTSVTTPRKQTQLSLDS